MNTLGLSIVGTAALGVVLSGAVPMSAAGGAQTPQQQKPQPQQQQPQSQQQKPQTQQQAGGQMATVMGCVYQTSDQPTVFALRGMGDKGGSSADRGAAMGTEDGRSAGRPQPGSTDKPAGAMDKMGQQAGNTEGAWYRLSSSAAQDLKQYVGKPVRVSGTLVPGKDDKGADVIIHRVTPQMTAVTAVDLKPAPEFRIQSVSAAQGQCPPAGQK